MPPLTDPERLRHYKHALSLWYVSGYVLWKPIAREWINENLPGLTAREVGRLMHEHVEAYGLEEAPEKRPEYSGDRYHYDLRLPIGRREVYIETLLVMGRNVDDTVIQVVSIHDR